MTATLRYRGDKNNIIELAKNLDAFKKVPEKYTETTEIGGTLSLLSRLFIIYLLYSELLYYLYDANVVYQFVPDIKMDEQVQMHVDITVAMPCTSLSGVDLNDETQQDVFAYGTLQREDTWWEMSPEQRANFDTMQMTNHYLREQYHSVADILFKDIIRSPEKFENKKIQDNSGIAGVFYGGNAPAVQRPVAEEQYDACRLHGTLGINKVAGVLHLVGGAQPVVGLFDDHFMIEFRRVPANFTHRINRLSFGQFSMRIVHPLEGDETFVYDEATTVQYFLKIVPTEVHRTFSTINTFQYAVTENVRKLDSERNSYGSPGIYFKYDWSALKIIVRNDRDNVLTFAIRLCSIIAGIIVISGILNAVLLIIQRRILNVLPLQLANKQQKESLSIKVPVLDLEPKTEPTSGSAKYAYNEISPSLGHLIPTNDLISAANQFSVTPKFLTATDNLKTTTTTTLQQPNSDYIASKKSQAIPHECGNP